MTDDDRSVALYHIVYPHEGFEESARALFLLVCRGRLSRTGSTSPDVRFVRAPNLRASPRAGRAAS